MFSFGHCPNQGGGGAPARIKKYNIYICIFDGRKRCTSCPKEGEERKHSFSQEVFPYIQSMLYVYFSISTFYDKKSDESSSSVRMRHKKFWRLEGGKKITFHQSFRIFRCITDGLAVRDHSRSVVISHKRRLFKNTKRDLRDVRGMVGRR